MFQSQFQSGFGGVGWGGVGLGRVGGGDSEKRPYRDLQGGHEGGEGELVDAEHGFVEQGDGDAHEGVRQAGQQAPPQRVLVLYVGAACSGAHRVSSDVIFPRRGVV